MARQAVREAPESDYTIFRRLESAITPSIFEDNSPFWPGIPTLHPRKRARHPNADAHPLAWLSRDRSQAPLGPSRAFKSPHPRSPAPQLQERFAQPRQTPRK